MSMKVTEEEASGRIGSEEMAIALTARLTEGKDPFRVDPIRWVSLDVPSIMVEEDLRLLRESYKISNDIRLMFPEPSKRACFPGLGVLPYTYMLSWANRKTADVVANYTIFNPPPFQRTLSVTATGDVVLDIPPKVFQPSGSSNGGSYDSKRKLRELIGPPGAKILDDALRNVLFYPSMGAQDFKKYFSPRWEDLASHGDLEDILEASLVTTVRTTGMQLKVLGEADLRESDSNVLHLTKKLDDANVVQKVTAEALEAANEEKRRLLEESTSHRLEAKGLRNSLDTSEAFRKEAEVEVARLLGEKKDLERKLKSVKVEYVANFHNTEAYTNFFNYFAKFGHQEVLVVLKSDYPDLSLGSLEARFSLPDVEGD
ncbi:Uncharacterized protein Adt_34617 [Abeliophyllum distichum]|uniref:Uncharacterized protein n=1 Tax=Abeliophyllum distichum TaxID=126358 RepID=A0ABD1R0K1_9LAMI